MIDESLQEYASLYVLGLLEGLELTAFQTQLERDPELQALVQQLTEASAELAHAAPLAEPSPELKARVLAKCAQLKPGAAAPAAEARRRPAPAERPASNVIAFPGRTWIPWAAAACLALSTGWFAQLFLTSRSENLMLRDQQTLAAYELKSAKNQLEAERLIARQETSTGTTQLAAMSEQLKFAEQQLAVANQRAAAVEARAKSEADLANFKISTLASLLGNSPQALAVAVWNPARQEGVLRVEKLPALAADKDYQLWLVDPQYAAPVDGGVFTVDPATGEARITFKADKPIKSVAKFAVSLERKGGVPKAEGPLVLLSQ